MGLSSAVSRGHMRPFGARSPPFLVATLCVGLCILAVSYWRLGIQYNGLEEQLRRLIQKKDSLEANESFISKQLELREENFSEAKVNLQKKEKELVDLKKRLDENAVKLQETQKDQDDLKQTLNNLKAELESKEVSLKELRDKNKALENENIKLKSDYTEIKSKLDSNNNKAENKKNVLEAQVNLDRSQSTNVIHPPLISKNSPKSNTPVLDENSKLKQSDKASLQQHQYTQEQIQKPKIDPVVNFVKNNDNKDQLESNEFSKKDGSLMKNYPYRIDEENGTGNGAEKLGETNVEDKDTLLDSNNLENTR